MSIDHLPDIPDEPLEYQWRPRAMVNFPSEMVVALAQGMEDPLDIAARFGITAEQWEKWSEYPPLKAAVSAKRAELEKNGWVVRTKAAMQAEMLMDQVFVQAMSNDVGLMQKLETLKTLIKVGNLEPKEDKTTQAGTGFQININLPGQNVTLGNAASTKLRPIDVLDIPMEDPDA